MGAVVSGWDGGGTKTGVVCLDEGGHLLGSARFGPLNPNGAPPGEVCATIRDALAFVRRFGACEALVVSLAGISHREAGALVGRVLAENGYHNALRLVGDQEAAFEGAVGDTGAVLIAGTGSICHGRNRAGETARCGGYGYLVDDEGSGYAIGRDIVSAALRARDGRTPPTKLDGLLARTPGWADLSDIMRNLYDPGFEKATIAALAPLLADAAGDWAADAIVAKAARELTLLAVTVIDRLGVATERVALTGGVLTGLRPVRRAVEAALTARYPALLGFEPLADAASGAARMAYRMIGKESDLHA
ncbi:MAG: ATPase [Clostridiales bacterium]|nr:ATPase [Clostridiales bacterium]